MPTPRYIFIGGIVRTGTDLLRNAFNALPDVRLAGETHYLGDPAILTLVRQSVTRQLPQPAPPDQAYYLWRLSRYGTRRKSIGSEGIPTETGAELIVNHIYDHLGQSDRAFWHWLVNNVERQALLANFLAGERTDGALFELLLSLYAAGAPIRGEKTPAHLFNVPTLLAWFPTAKFVHMLRDPRAVFVSQRRKKANTPDVSRLYQLFRRTPASYDVYLSLGISISWLRATSLHAYYQRAYPDRYCLLRFEDLIVQPEAQLRQLCQFVAIDFDERMLQRRVVNSSYVPRNQVMGFDPSVVTRWRQHIHPLTKRWFARLCGSRLSRFGYSD
ncbi:MAG: sulfotransferase [Anaerolineales bacterium]|nr:sulfotransferase [Anaerolineales bacterium]